MTPTSWRELASTFAVVAVVAHLLTRLNYGALPPLPLLAGITLLVLALLELVLGFSLKARIERRPGTRPVQPLVAARALALAKASAWAGTVMAAVWAGLLGYLLPRVGELSAAADDTPGSVVGLVSAAALVAAALWLEYCCRAPRDADQDPTRDQESDHH